MSTAMATAPAMAITTYHQCQEKAGGDDGSERRMWTETGFKMLEFLMGKKTAIK